MIVLLKEHLQEDMKITPFGFDVFDNATCTIIALLVANVGQQPIHIFLRFVRIGICCLYFCPGKMCQCACGTNKC